MSQPPDIPQDVWTEAGQVLNLLAVTPEPAERQMILSRWLLIERERCAAVCEQQAREFLSPQYAWNQPIGSLTERFACEQCAEAIRKGVA